MTHVPWHPEDLGTGEELHGIESVELISVGIDIGTTTTHLMFSRLLARRRGSSYSSKFQIVEREIIYQSQILLTPYTDETTVDTEEIQEFIQTTYEKAGYDPSDVDTGAVIITGEASRKENAEAITGLFSEQAGKFVCATAGANLESLMAAHGSGAVDYSLDTGQNVLHIDSGGGTTKLAYIVDGFVEETASINVGARLVETTNDEITRLERAGKVVGNNLGIDLSLGDRLSEEQRTALATDFAEILFELIDGNYSPLVKELMVTEPAESKPFDVITFSGGVAEYIYDRDPGYYGDLGPELGAAIRHEIEENDLSTAMLETGIRATAVGSTQHSIQVSGNTLTITDESLLPIHNIPMIPFVADHNDSAEALVEDIKDKLLLYDVDKGDEGFAFGFHLHGSPTYDFLQTIVDAAVMSWRQFDGQHPLILAFESDVAMNAGRLAVDQIDEPVISVDGVELDQFGYIDIGDPLESTNAVPLTVKSLLFEG